MSKPLIIKNAVEIEATPDRVWDALVNPVKTKKYLYGCEPESDWHPGSLLLWKGELHGEPRIFVKGEIVEIYPEKRLVYTTIDPHSEIPDIPENYLLVTYSLERKNENTILTVTQGDYSKVANGAERYNDTYAENGWSGILEQMKNIVEANL